MKRLYSATLRHLLELLLGTIFLTSGSAWAAPAVPPPTNRDCLECHSDKTLTKTNAAGKAILLFVDNDRFIRSIHRTNACVSCHSDITAEHPDNDVAAKPVNCSVCHADQSETYNRSVHALALKSGKEGAATCADCHGKHDILSHTAPGSPLHFSQLTATCGECHPEIAAEVVQSVHGKSVARGHREAATCIDCHSEHKIEDLRASSPWKISEEVCSKCHSSERINTKFRMPSDRVKTFMESYHGLASHYGSMRAANCASCHGTHLILRSFDPRSSIYSTNLVSTCGKCHPGASEKFAQGRIHVDVTVGEDLGTRISFWVRRVYLVIIFGTIGLMFAHNFLSWRRLALAALYSSERVVLRMDLAQRAQHLVLALSFIILAITGFALRYPDSWLAWLLGSSEGFRRVAHRAAGILILGLGVYHMFYVLLTHEGRRMVLDLLPRRKDAEDIATHVKYLVSHGKPRAKFARFGYVEKMEYWAVIWGTIIMGATGLLIWFKIDVTQFFPRWAVDVAVTIHYYEAILACLAILVWHFYFVFFDPAVYPINWAWWDGRVTRHWQEHEHPLDIPKTELPASKPDKPDPTGS